MSYLCNNHFTNKKSLHKGCDCLKLCRVTCGGVWTVVIVWTPLAGMLPVALWADAWVGCEPAEPPHCWRTRSGVGERGRRSDWWLCAAALENSDGSAWSAPQPGVRIREKRQNRVQPCESKSPSSPVDWQQYKSLLWGHYVLQHSLGRIPEFKEYEWGIFFWFHITNWLQDKSAS